MSLEQTIQKLSQAHYPIRGIIQVGAGYCTRDRETYTTKLGCNDNNTLWIDSNAQLFQNSRPTIPH